MALPDRGAHDVIARWVRPAGNAAAPGSLFCLPHAGGTPVAFAGWAGRLPSFDIAIADYGPGRGTAGRSVEALAAALVDELRWSTRPTVLFGHSMGALVALEVARQLRGADRPPRLLAVAGSAPPGLGLILPDTLDEADAGATIRFVTALDPASVRGLADDEVREAMLDGVRDDLRIVAAYRPNRSQPVECPIAVFAGQQDSLVSLEAAEAWRDWTRREMTLDLLPGGHFFHRQAGDLFLEVLEERFAAVGGRGDL